MFCGGADGDGVLQHVDAPDVGDKGIRSRPALSCWECPMSKINMRHCSIENDVETVKSRKLELVK
jgi:hypothetical protein